MAKDIIQELWDKGKEQETMTTAQIEALLEPQIRRNAFSLTTWIWFYLGIAVITLVLSVINVFGYWTNPIMLSVQIAACILLSGFTAYGIFLLRDLAQLNWADGNVLDISRRRLKFHRTKLEIWFWVIAFTTYLLGFAINSMVDNQDGVYRINRIGAFVGISVAMIMFMYAVMKVAQFPLVTELKAIISDLENQLTVETDRVAELKRTWRLWSVLLCVLLSFLFVWGLIRFFQ